MPNLIDNFAQNLLAYGLKQKNVVVLESDNRYLSKTHLFSKHTENRFYSFGLSEKDMISTASGLASMGKIPIVCAFAGNLTGNAWQQIKNNICLPNLNVKMIGINAGILSENYGYSSPCVEDIALMLPLPNLKIFSPANEEEGSEIFKHMINTFGPMYLRLSSFEYPETEEQKNKFEEGEPILIKKGSQISLIVTGPILNTILKIINNPKSKIKNFPTIYSLPTLKPINLPSMEKIAKKSKKIIVIEDHREIGALGSILSQTINKKFSCEIHSIGLKDTFFENKNNIPLCNPEKLFKEINEICKKNYFFVHGI